MKLKIERPIALLWCIANTIAGAAFAYFLWNTLSAKDIYDALFFIVVVIIFPVALFLLFSR